MVPFNGGNDNHLAQSQTLIVPRIQQDKALGGSHAISALGRWCDRMRIPAPEYTFSNTAPFSAKLLIAGVEFNTEGLPTKIDAKRTVAWAAVEHFRRAGESFFAEEGTAVDWVSALMTYCAVNNLGKVHIDVHIVSDDPRQYTARVNYGGHVLEYPDLPQNTKQAVKAQAAKQALEAIRSGKIPRATKRLEAPHGYQHVKAFNPPQYRQITASESPAPSYIKQEHDTTLKQPFAYHEGDFKKYDPASSSYVGPYTGHSHSPPRSADSNHSEHGHRDDNSAISSGRKHPHDEDADDNNNGSNRRLDYYQDSAAAPQNQLQRADAASANVVQSLVSSLVWGNATKRADISSGSEDEPDTPAPAMNAAAAGASSSSSASRQGNPTASRPARFPSYTDLLDIACFTRHLRPPQYADISVGDDSAAIGGYRCSVTVDGKTFGCARAHEKGETAKEDVAGDAYKWLLKRDGGG
ncbi:hypothetical protein HDU87_005270 [Geranomyces variabilis]|uniref:DRBM domain-containing protein n=1 Tax=Geranomyces variabilis TaxID=109894 RepID=A0AAD5TJP2_9FUNG|nr:hypothetical protein HDU87_005270 [Geranomyces variabilis]